MTIQEVKDLMLSSKNREDWGKNCNIIKKKCNGYPDFWYREIIQSGLCDEVLGEGSSKMKIIEIHTTKSSEKIKRGNPLLN
jgi:hypothetical protein|tara:strand:+ start:3312 stop:3554 length:243 start_codon:yes stop_codon:yes gene_type:complete